MVKLKVYDAREQVTHDLLVSANNWGELRSELNNKGIMTDGMKPTVKETQSSFESDAAPLPSGLGKDINGSPNGYDFTLFLNPQKTKSGK